jgi:hypothetical protein
LIMDKVSKEPEGIYITNKSVKRVTLTLTLTLRVLKGLILCRTSLTKVLLESYGRIIGQIIII